MHTVATAIRVSTALPRACARCVVRCDSATYRRHPVGPAVALVEDPEPTLLSVVFLDLADALHGDSAGLLRELHGSGHVRVPCSAFDQKLTNEEFKGRMARRLGFEVCEEGPCPFCFQAMDRFGAHAESCMGGGDKTLRLREALHTLVLDEADLLLSYGYGDDLTAIGQVLAPSVHTLLFSATLSPDVEGIGSLLLHNVGAGKRRKPTCSRVPRAKRQNADGIRPPVRHHPLTGGALAASEPDEPVKPTGLPRGAGRA